MKGFFPSSTFVGKQTTISTAAKCGACGLYKKCKSPKLPVIGEGRRGILIILEAPGEVDDMTGKPFTGKSAQYLRSVLGELQIDMLRDCWLTYAVICRPSKGVTSDQVDYCQPNLINTINELKPTTIIPFGLAAVRSLVRRIWREDDIGQLSRWLGYQIPSQQFNAWICPNWNPSFVSGTRNEVMMLWFHRYLEQALNFDERPYTGPIPDYDSQIEIVTDPKKVRKIIRSRMGSKFAAFDYETNMLKPDSKRAKIVSCSICWDGEQTIAFKYGPDVAEVFDEFLCSDIGKIASNKKFEERWTKRIFGHRVRNWKWCTMIAAHILDCRPGITSIKFQSFVRLGVPCYEERVEPFLSEANPNSVNRIHEIDEQHLLLYNGLDSLLEYLVAMQQMEEINNAHGD